MSNTPLHMKQDTISKEKNSTPKTITITPPNLPACRETASNRSLRLLLHPALSGSSSSRCLVRGWRTDQTGGSGATCSYRHCGLHQKGCMLRVDDISTMVMCDADDITGYDK